MSARDPRRVLAAVDFSPSSHAALEHAAELARAADAELHVVHAFVHPTHVGIGPDPVALASTKVAERQSVENELHEWCDGVRRDGLDVVEHLVDDQAAAGILECAKDLRADRLVMGVHGRGKLEELLLGSVTREVQRQAPCPVTTVRAKAEYP